MGTSRRVSDNVKPRSVTSAVRLTVRDTGRLVRIEVGIVIECIGTGEAPGIADFWFHENRRHGRGGSLRLSVYGGDGTCEGCFRGDLKRRCGCDCYKLSGEGGGACWARLNRCCSGGNRGGSGDDDAAAGT